MTHGNCYLTSACWLCLLWRHQWFHSLNADQLQITKGCLLHGGHSKQVSLLVTGFGRSPWRPRQTSFLPMPPWFFLSILPSRKNLQGATSDLLIIIFWMPVTFRFRHFKTGNQNTTMSSKQNCRRASVPSSLVCRNSTCFHGAGQSRTAPELFSVYDLSNRSFSELVNMWYKHHWLCKTTCRIKYLKLKFSTVTLLIRKYLSLFL